MNHRNANLSHRREQGKVADKHFSLPHDLQTRVQLRLLVALSADTFLRLHICFLRGDETQALRVAGILIAAVWRMQSTRRVTYDLARQTHGATEVSTSSFDDEINRG
jgi:hypothetical protein